MSLDVGNHISDSDHLRYVDGELDETEIEIIEEHLATCMRCRDFNDDLAAASDGLTAFLNRADFQPRALAYGPRVVGGWWNSPLAKAAAIVGLLVGAALPVGMFLIAAPADQNSAVFSPAVPELAPVDRSSAPRLAPVDRGSVPVADDRQRGIGDAASSFTIDFSSWQAGGELKLVFSGSDVVIYHPGGRTGAVASINTMTGLMSIRNMANETSDHEIWIPANYGPEDVTVRIAGRIIPFTPTPHETGGEAFVVVGVVPTEVATISLQMAERRR